PAAAVRPGQVRHPRHRHVAPGKRALDRPLHALLGARHLPRRQELAVRQMRQTQPLPAHADEPLDVAVPRRQVPVSDRPVDAVAVAQVGCEIEVAPPPARPAPDQAAAAELVAADPTERLVLRSDVWVLAIIHEEVSRRLAKGVVFALDRVVALVQPLLAPPAMGELPGLPPLGDVVLAVLQVAAALEHERAQPLFAELLGRPSTGDTGAHDDGVERFAHTAHARPIWSSGTHPSN